jgi:plasmid stabilization system protein ParE
MAREVVWSTESVGDLDALANYIAKDSPIYAASFIREILNLSYSLSELSKRGRVVPEFGDTNIRELFVRDYRMIYLIENKRVVVLALVHGNRDLDRLWKMRQ